MPTVARKPLRPFVPEEVLVEGFFALGTPDGFRAELIEGEIVVTALPEGDHEDCVGLILSQVLKRSRTDMQFSGRKGLTLGRADGSPQDHVIPDGAFAAQSLRLYRGAVAWMPSQGVSMVLEVTSTRPEVDREVKRRCYARGGVPLYLLIDRDISEATLFSDPRGDDYRERRTVPFGKPLSLPEPFAFDLETSDFL
ncbi:MULTISPECIES: Uma2 family endonuclease [Streptomyces]|uniref:Uma2 family endonuclease n=1 Tax=Streptomyces TaxID=1883 RepID=UPI0008E58CE0|nr:MULTISPECIES: Uma2 family endonuclease [unclassified Streptomyces]UJV43915.1 Uma2 family endonuclease [Streptomyces sp. AMCC400023]SFM72749.1 Endonuclease, Uma2 family (restriction endonuclease fold) [Streptomyces sp. cf124]